MGTCDSRNNKKNLKNMSEGERIYLQCKECREKLSKYVSDLEAKEKNSREKAKDLLRKKQRDRAKFYLKQGKLYKEQARIAQGKLDIMENQVINIENAKNAKETLDALKKGNEALQKLQKEIKLEDLDKIKDDIEDLKEKDKEIGDYLKERGLENEAECEEELNQLTKEIQGVNNNNNNINLPNVPNTQINANNQVKVPQNNIINQNQNKLIAT